MSGRILEREGEIGALLARARAAAEGHGGAVALLRGEAGIGKSTVVAALREALEAATEPGRVLVGHCDDLATPRVLGPLRDLAPSVGAGLATALRGEDRDRLLTEVVEELSWAGHATVLVVEDLHWVDEATLDVLSVLVRRVVELPTLLVLTFRDDLDRSHPLHRLLAVAHRGPLLDLPLAALSPDAVAALGGDPELHRLTGGNPFFVQQLLSHPSGVPMSVLESVLARLDHLPDHARAAVEQLSVLSAPATTELVRRLIPEGLAGLVAAEEQGLLTVSPRRVDFRHELTRRAVLDALPAARRSGCHAAALTALASLRDTDLAGLVHHAVGAGDAATVVRLGPHAARAAAGAGAHRQAAAHYRAVLDHRERFPPEELADLLQEAAVEGYAVGDGDRSALDDQRESVALRRRLGDERRLGTGLRWLSRIAWWCGDGRLAQQAGSEAVEHLDKCGSTAEQALAHSNLSQIAMLAGRLLEATSHARRALDLAGEVGDQEVVVHALNNLGTARWAAGDQDGRGDLELSLRTALAIGADEHATRAYCNLAWQCLAVGLLDDAAAYLDDALAHAERAEHLLFTKYLHVEEAMVALGRARWADARDSAEQGLDGTPPMRSSALTVLGSVATRTGDPAAGAIVARAWRLALELDELQRTGPAAVLVCEHAWLTGTPLDPGPVLRVREEAARLGHVDVAEQVGWWLGLVGEAAPAPPTSWSGGLPYGLLARRRWREASECFEELGYPYEAALALTFDDDQTALLDALARLDDVGAAPLADRVRRDLRRRGAAGVPRGPRPDTVAHPGGLTPRQCEVLELLAQGHSNAEIAVLLVLSVRTVDHHVVALLRKTGTTSRAAAVSHARALDWLVTAPSDG